MTLHEFEEQDWQHQQRRKIMFNINRTLKKGVRYPDKELLGDYHGLHFADLISTPAVRAISGADNTIEFGDSGY